MAKLLIGLFFVFLSGSAMAADSIAATSSNQASLTISSSSEKGATREIARKKRKKRRRHRRHHRRHRRHY